MRAFLATVLFLFGASASRADPAELSAARAAYAAFEHERAGEWRPPAVDD